MEDRGGCIWCGTFCIVLCEMGSPLAFD